MLGRSCLSENTVDLQTENMFDSETGWQLDDMDFFTFCISGQVVNEKYQKVFLK